MNELPQESPQERNIRFQGVIRRTWKCGSIYKEDCLGDIPPFAEGYLSKYELTGGPKEHPEARQCFVWDGKKFKDDNNDVPAVLDVQVLEDNPRDLPRMVVWAWFTDSLIKDADIYVKSEKWSKDQIHEMHKAPVQFGVERRLGKFFVRERADGGIAVRIFSEKLIDLNGRKEYIFPSFSLSLPAIERIEPPHRDSDLYSLLYV